MDRTANASINIAAHSNSLSANKSKLVMVVMIQDMKCNDHESSVELQTKKMSQNANIERKALQLQDMTLRLYGL